MNLYCDITLSNDELTALVSAIQLTEEQKRIAIEKQCGSVKLAGLQTKLAEQIQDNIKFLEQIDHEETTQTTQESNQSSGDWST